MIDIEEIKRRIKKTNLCENNASYNGFNMSKTHSQDEENRKIDIHNRKVISLFSDLWDVNYICKYFDCWKGVCFWKDYRTEFSGWCSEDIIQWLLAFNSYEQLKIFKEQDKKYDRIYQEMMEEERIIIKNNVGRIITTEDRYNVLKRQKWRCNICGTKLKYDKHSQFGEEVAHIDHIHPYSKKESYTNGIKNINEIENLQALCPKCNRDKWNKQVN